MVIRILFAFCILAVSSAVAPAREKAADHATNLLEKTLDNGRRIAITVSPIGDAAALDGLVHANWIVAPTRAYCLQLRLLRDHHDPVVLWSVVHLDTPKIGAVGCAAFDLFQYQGRVLIAVSSWGFINLWRVDLLTGSAEHFVLPGAQWSRFAAIRPIGPDSVSVHFGHTEKGLVTATVKELNPRSNKTTVFTQVDGAWKFVVDDEGGAAPEHGDGSRHGPGTGPATAPSGASPVHGG